MLVALEMVKPEHDKTKANKSAEKLVKDSLWTK
jgi:hypothetical protein